MASQNELVKQHVESTIYTNTTKDVTGNEVRDALLQVLDTAFADKDAALMKVECVMAPIDGGGTITLTNGANTITGVSTDFTLSDGPGGLSNWGQLMVRDTSGDLFVLQGIDVIDATNATFQDHYNVSQNPYGISSTSGGSGNLGANWTGATLTTSAALYLCNAEGASLATGIGVVIGAEGSETPQVAHGFEQFIKAGNLVAFGKFNYVDTSRAGVDGETSVFGQNIEVKTTSPQTLFVGANIFVEDVATNQKIALVGYNLTHLGDGVNVGMDNTATGEQQTIFARNANVQTPWAIVYARNTTMTANAVDPADVGGRYNTFNHSQRVRAVACSTCTIGTGTATGEPINVTFLGYTNEQLDDQGLEDTVSMPTAHFGQQTIVRNFANDTAAAAGGVPIGGQYHTSGTLKIRLV